MYQPENDLAIYEVPTARETTPMPVSPGRVCPDKPDRECMIRYLYAQKHRHNVKCATCGPVSAKVSSMRRGQKLREERERLTGMSDAEWRRERQRENSRKQEAKRKAARQARLAARTPQEIEAQRQKRLEQLARGRETQRLLRETAMLQAKKTVLTQEEKAEKQERARLQRIANLEKGRATIAAKKSALAEDIKKKYAERARERRKEKVTANRARPLPEDREITLRANLELARTGTKPANRCEAVVLALEWMLETGIESVAMMDMMGAVNKFLSKKISRSGALGMSVRDYGLTVHVQHVGGGVSRSTLYLDDKARAFVAGGYLKFSRVSKRAS